MYLKRRMYYVYIIKANKNSWYYVGFTKNLTKRLIEHNSGKVRSTKSHKPFRLVYAQKVSGAAKARNLEKYLKVRFNKEALLDLLNN